MKILVLNSGSSSLKYKLFEDDQALVEGLVEKIGEKDSIFKYGSDFKEVKEIKDHEAALKRVVKILADEKIGVIKDAYEIEAIGHRVVHGGEDFSSPTIIDEKVIEAIKKMIPLAPLHNPANLKGIEVARDIFKKAKQVAVFDTAFHQSMPAYAFHYPIPMDLYDKYKIRRYGFHGTSHLYVAHKACEHLKRDFNQLKLITVHLGNGCSITAIKDGKSIDTSMGMTPLEGLIMGTRCGDIDPSIPYFLAKEEGINIDEINNLLNKKSGLKGICGLNDLRDIIEKEQAGDQKSRLAMEMYTYRIKKYIGSYMAVLGGLDAIIFTAGVGENASNIRKYSCNDLGHLGIELDPEKNNIHSHELREIQSNNSNVKVLVVPTNEELEIAHEVATILK